MSSSVSVGSKQKTSSGVPNLRKNKNKNSKKRQKKKSAATDPLPRIKQQVYQAVNRDVALYSQYAKQLLVPNASSNLLTIPNTTPAAVSTRVYSRTIDLSQATHANGKIVMFPDLFHPGFISGSNTLGSIPPSAPGRASCTVKMHSDASASFTKGVGKARSGEDVAYFPCAPIPDLDQMTFFGIKASMPASTGGGPIRITVKNVGKEGSTAGMMVRILQGGYWQDCDYWLPLPMAPGAIQTVDYVLNVQEDITAIGFSVSGVTVETAWHVDISSEHIQFVGTEQKDFFPAFGKQIIDSGITTGRVLSMTMLFHNTSPPLSKGGTVSAARAPRSIDLFSPFSPQFEKLPGNRKHIGDLESGAYVVWLPSQSDEIEVNDVPLLREIYDDSEFIAIEFGGWPAGASARVTFTWLVEFYTESQNFTKALCPPRDPRYAAFYNALLMHPAAMCNPSHIENIQAFIAGVRSYLKHAYDFYSSHRTEIDLVATTMLGAGSLL